MSIYRAKYTRYHGALDPLSRRYFAIASEELRRFARDKWFRRLILMSGLPALILGVYIYLAAILEQGFGWDPLGGDIFTRLYSWQPWFILLLFAAFGSAQISRDIKTRALTLYFTRSVTAFQYLMGKLTALVVVALLMTLVPGVLLAVTQFAMKSTYGVWEFADTLWRVVMTSALIAWFMSSLILMLSSITGVSSRVTGMVWLVSFICLIMLRQILATQMGLESIASVVSPYDIVVGTSAVCFQNDLEALPALIANVVLSVFFTYALYVRIQSFERAYT